MIRPHKKKLVIVLLISQIRGGGGGVCFFYFLVNLYIGVKLDDLLHDLVILQAETDLNRLIKMYSQKYIFRLH
jgi:hypothetical protein